jgi:hypothetical protein
MLCMCCVFVFGVPHFIIVYAPIIFFIISLTVPLETPPFIHFLHEQVLISETTNLHLIHLYAEKLKKSEK